LLLFRQIAPLRAYIHQQRTGNKTIGFVPTMGALHAGHVSLIEQSIQENDLTVCSIFVNPTQFNNAEDLAKYPRTLENDMLMLEEAGCDVLFHPDGEEMYPDGFVTERYDWGAVTHSLEGAFRPGHFDGVITIVRKLFDVVEPDRAYFGQKDFQQCAVIVRMVKEFDMPVAIRIMPTLREADGLAMSSRNTRLSAEERKESLLIFKALKQIHAGVKDHTPAKLILEAMNVLNTSPLMKPEYVAIVDRETLQPIEKQSDLCNSVALIASWCGNVRLIDNMILNESE
jgi:pantoate--beta-alanine ligase